MNTRALIICAGEATRWGNYLDTPKHLIEIEGEKILHRSVRLLKENGIDDIHVISKDDPRYKVEGANQFIAELNPKNADADKLLSSQKLWEKADRILIIYGDCYYTEEAMKTIVESKEKDWHIFCRPDASAITGTPWGEIFCYSFYRKDFDLIKNGLHHVAGLHQKGLLKRCGGWELYRHLLGRPDANLRIHKMGDHYTKIDDWTDDFDYPKDYDSWIQNRSLQGKA